MELAGFEKNDDDLIVRTTNNYKEESKTAKRDRMEMNKRNFDVYHLKQDLSHKLAGQSREFLGKQQLAVEQITTFFQQGLIDQWDWFGVELENGVKADEAFLSESEVKVLLGRQLEFADLYTTIHDATKLGLIGSLMIVKVHGCYEEKPIFQSQKKILGFKVKDKLIKKSKQVWRLKFSLIRQEDYNVDPSGRGLYQMHDVYMDIAELYKMADGPDALYDKKVLDRIQSNTDQVEDDKQKKARESGQTVVYTDFRRKVKITECWGSILDPTTGRVLYEDVTWTVANDHLLLSRPKPNPFWHGKAPFIVTPIIRVPNSVWHRSLMDAPTRHNIAINELYNLIVDAGMMATHGIKQIRTDCLEDSTQVSNGIPPGTTLSVTGALPFGQKVLERVDTSSMSPESLTVFNLINSEFNQSSLTNDLRMGVLPARQVKATEIVEASQTITSVFTGIAKQVENQFIQKLLEMSWLNILQHMDDLDAADIKAELGTDRAIALAALSPEDLFAKVANGHKFRVFGISRTLDKVKDFRKIQSLLQTIAGSEILTEEFVKKYDFAKLLEEIMRSLDIDVARLRISPEDEAINSAIQASQSGGQVQGPNVQSQIPQASTGSLNPTVESLIPRENFPASPVSNLGKG